MSTDDLVVTLAMHAARHLFERLEWLAGIARLLLARPDAPALLAHADRLHARRMLLVTAGVAMRVLDTPLGPEWKIALADDPESERLVAMMSEMTPAGAADEASALGGAKLQRLYARLLDSRVDRVVSIIRAAIMPTEREWEAIALPDALTPLYYVLRPARVIAMYGSRALRRAPT
jgi:hypothetical protein